MDDACNKFRGYLHKTGVNDAFVIALTELYRLKERPANPTEFIRQNLPPAQAESIASLTAELDELEKEIDNLRKMIPPDRLPPRKDDDSKTEMSNVLETASISESMIDSTIDTMTDVSVDKTIETTVDTTADATVNEIIDTKVETSVDMTLDTTTIQSTKLESQATDHVSLTSTDMEADGTVVTSDSQHLPENSEKPDETEKTN